MKRNCLVCTLLLLLAIVVQLPAQQSEADRKLFEQIKANAENGDAQSQCKLGAVFHVGKFGVAKDETEAVNWYRKAADQNHPDAQYIIGVCYASGNGVVKDEAKAVEWYRKSASQSYAEAQYNLGVCYSEGKGVTKDENEAAKLWRKASEQNHANAQYNLGVCYAFAHGVAKDETEAVNWYRKAAEQNHADAQYNLGVCYYKGEGVAKDYVKAYEWTLLSAAQGNEYAKKAVVVIENKMLREQVAEGKKPVLNFRSGVAGHASLNTNIAPTTTTTLEPSNAMSGDEQERIIAEVKKGLPKQLIKSGITVALGLGLASVLAARFRKKRSIIENDDDAYELLAEAAKLERKGKLNEALAKYEIIVSKAAGSNAAKDAEISIQQLKERLNI